MAKLNYGIVSLALAILTAPSFAQAQSLKHKDTENGPSYSAIENKIDAMLPTTMQDNANSSKSPTDKFDSGLNFQWPFAPMTKMHEAAEIFAPHPNPTLLFLNFDGRSSEGVSPFETTTGDRERDIQEILFIVSQAFAPFNVKVQRMHGNNGQYTGGGATTIFIGDKSSNSTVLEGNSSHTINNSWASADADYPCPWRGATHEFNSDDYNTAHVDPVRSESLNGVEIFSLTWDNTTIARFTCHEAGHTFGLAHVLTPLYTSDMMAYYSENWYFNYQDFELTNLDTVGGGAPVPNWDVTAMWWFYQFNVKGQVQVAQAPLETQNSYRTLLATLGARPTDDDIANVANRDFVDIIYQDADPREAFQNYIWVSTIDRQGDYDVYDFQPSEDSSFRIEIDQTSGELDPIVMVWDSNGFEMIAYDDNSGSGSDAKVHFVGIAGEQYKIVVGSKDSNDTGGYAIKVEPVDYKVNPDFETETDFTIDMDTGVDW